MCGQRGGGRLSYSCGFHAMARMAVHASRRSSPFPQGGCCAAAATDGRDDRQGSHSSPHGCRDNTVRQSTRGHDKDGSRLSCSYGYPGRRAMRGAATAGPAVVAVGAAVTEAFRRLDLGPAWDNGPNRRTASPKRALGNEPHVPNPITGIFQGISMTQIHSQPKNSAKEKGRGPSGPGIFPQIFHPHPASATPPAARTATTATQVESSNSLSWLLWGPGPVHEFKTPFIRLSCVLSHCRVARIRSLGRPSGTVKAPFQFSSYRSRADMQSRRDDRDSF
jgi:hypothetical protein